MKISRHIYDLFRRLLLPALVGVLAVSCVDDSSLCIEDQPGYNDADNVWISLEVKNQGLSGTDIYQTRADILNDALGHPEETASEAENFIDLNDITIVLLDENGSSMKVLTADDFFLKSITGTGYSEYELIAKVNRAYFNFAGKSMGVLAVANAKGISRSDLTHDSYNVVQFQTSLDDLTSEMRKFSYDGYSDQGSLTPWQPGTNTGRHIPMAGLKKGIVVPDASELDAAITTDTAIDLGAIIMQRSMAKIRVLDGIRNQDQTLLPYARTEITSVNFCSGTHTGVYVPPTTQIGVWANGTFIFERAPIPSPATAWNDASLKIHTFKGGNFQTTTTDGTTQKYEESFICYATETAISSLRNTNVRPYLEIVTTAYNDDGSAVETKTHMIYLDECLSEYTDIARNHIYEFIVTMSEKADVSIDYTVCEWKQTTSSDITFN